MENKCENCLYCDETGECWLERLEGIDRAECENAKYKFWEEKQL